jgi:GNAT superfamily N-acetyltransferase
MHVRDATLADLPRIVALLQQLSRDDEVREADPHDAVYREAFAQIAADRAQRLLVVESDRATVVATGVVRITPNLSHKGRSIAHVESVVVDEAERSRGIGALLMSEIERIARDAGCFRIELTSNQARLDAHRFYEKLGYAPTHIGFKKRLA